MLKFDREGNLLSAWGGPSDPGFFEESCREADGCFWPAREHGIFVDHNDFVYVAGNGEDGGARQQQNVATYPWAPSFGGDDSHILKFTADGTFVYQIGTAGMDAPNSEKIDGGPNGTPQPYLVADMSVDAKTNRLYIADGYGNRRILIVDAATGQYVGHFGAYGQNPVVDDPSSGVADTDVGPWIADYQAGNLKPLFFRSPLHCATVSSDGFLYACDRGNNRVQIFELAAAELGKPCANPKAEVGKCGFVGEIHVAPQTASGTSGTATLSTDPGQTCLYVGDLGNGTLYIINRENRTELDRIGRAGRQAGEFHWLHALAVDSRGDIYTGEVDTGQRVQKFLRYGASSCSGTGSADVGLYEQQQVGSSDDARRERASRCCRCWPSPRTRRPAAAQNDYPTRTWRPSTTCRTRTRAARSCRYPTAARGARRPASTPPRAATTSGPSTAAAATPASARTRIRCCTTTPPAT